MSDHQSSEEHTLMSPVPSSPECLPGFCSSDVEEGYEEGGYFEVSLLDDFSRELPELQTSGNRRFQSDHFDGSIYHIVCPKTSMMVRALRMALMSHNLPIRAGVTPLLMSLMSIGEWVEQSTRLAGCTLG